MQKMQRGHSHITLKITTMDLNKLLQLPTETLREPKTQSMVSDLIICLRDGVSITSWLEDCSEDPDAYPYTPDDLETFLFTINQL